MRSVGDLAMTENRMDLYRFLRPIGSAPVARKRLQGLLEFERRVISQTDLLAVLRDEILTVVSRRVAIDPDEAQVWLDRGHGVSTLVVRMAIPNRSHATSYA
jgi:cell division topological specificity factor